VGIEIILVLIVFIINIKFMATIINEPRPADQRTFVESDSSGWVVATIILVALIGAAVYIFMHYRRVTTVTPTPTPGATINLTLPDNGTGGNNGTGGSQQNSGANTNAGASYAQ
jgi:amino acid transporter